MNVRMYLRVRIGLEGCLGSVSLGCVYMRLLDARVVKPRELRQLVRLAFVVEYLLLLCGEHRPVCVNACLLVFAYFDLMGSTGGCELG